MIWAQRLHALNHPVWVGSEAAGPPSAPYGLGLQDMAASSCAKTHINPEQPTHSQGNQQQNLTHANVDGCHISLKTSHLLPTQPPPHTTPQWGGGGSVELQVSRFKLHIPSCKL